ncbi:MAG: 3-deoxy-7-phosphoheptulonate synthase [Polyangiales bacterium]
MTERPEAAQAVPYADTGALGRAKAELRRLPPLVTSFEIERLKGLIADAQAGRRFVLQGVVTRGNVGRLRVGIISNKLKILLQCPRARPRNTPSCAHRSVCGSVRKAAFEARRDACVTRRGTRLTLPSFFWRHAEPCRVHARRPRQDPGAPC